MQFHLSGAVALVKSGSVAAALQKKRGALERAPVMREIERRG